MLIGLLKIERNKCNITFTYPPYAYRNVKKKTLETIWVLNV